MEAPLGVMGIRDIWVKIYRDTGYLGEKLMGYLENSFGNTEHKKLFLKE